MADPKSDSNEPQEILESDLSGSEYQESVTESESDEDEDEPELEVDEPDTAIAQKKKKGKEKKVKPGVLFREEVRLMRDVNDGGSQKRKAPSESHRCVILARLNPSLICHFAQIINFQEDEAGNSDRRVLKLVSQRLYSSAPTRPASTLCISKFSLF